ncbi:MAG TPA: DUF1501 domain-containing protein [Anaerolineae bacterium]|nr:DUF1501 domain-containing protein [Anaerolineae bacterium]
MAANSLVPTSLLGSTEAVGIERLGDFNFNGHWRWEDAQRLALRYMYNGDTWLHQAGEQTLNAIDVVELANPGSYIPDHDAVYPDSDFGDALQILAQLIKLDVGLHVATVDLGGWDTHEHQGDQGTGYFASQVQGLAEGLAAFYTDLLDYSQRLTVVVMSEFGRRLRENGNHGTDHGHGNVVLVLGGNVNGGQVFVDPWPGLERSQLDNGVDLAITIDYRRVLSEILVRRMQNPRLGMVFPGYTDYTPLGIVSGPDLPIDYDNSINIVDIQKAAACFGIAEGNCAQWDLDASGAVDAGDLQELADRWEPSAL